MKKRIMMLVSTLALVALAGMAQAATKLAVQDNAVTPVDVFAVTDAGWIGIGGAAVLPTSPIHAITNGTTIASAGLTFQFTANGVNPQYFIAPNFSLYRNNDASLAGGGQPRLDDALGYFNFGTMNGATKANRALFYARSEKAWTATDQPAYFQFMTNPGSNLANREILRVSAYTNLATVNGGLRLYPYTGTGGVAVGTGPNPPAKPACDATTQGTLWFTKGVSAKDTLELCANGDSTGTNFAWRPIY